MSALQELPQLDFEALAVEVAAFQESCNANGKFGSGVPRDGKSLGTHVEKEFKSFLRERYQFAEGRSHKEPDLPGLPADIKATSKAKPQSSAKWESDRQTIFGLGYGIALFVYETADEGGLKIVAARLIRPENTGHTALTRDLTAALEASAREAELKAIFERYKLRFTPDELAGVLHDLLSGASVPQGEITIVRAFQWRLYYGKAPGSTLPEGIGEEDLDDEA